MLCAIWTIGVPAGLLLGAAIVRFAVFIANTTLGLNQSRLYDHEGNKDEEDVEEYLQWLRTRRAIPKPSFGQSMMIVFVNSLFISGLYLLIGFLSFVTISGKGGQVITLLLSLPGSFLVMSGLLALLLPTLFSRACLVALFYYLIGMAIGAGVFLVLLAVAVIQAQGG